MACNLGSLGCCVAPSSCSQCSGQDVRRERQAKRQGRKRETRKRDKHKRNKHAKHSAAMADIKNVRTNVPPCVVTRTVVASPAATTLPQIPYPLTKCKRCTGDSTSPSCCTASTALPRTLLINELCHRMSSCLTAYPTPLPVLPALPVCCLPVNTYARILRVPTLPWR